jgi:hypothetical protein
MDKLQNYDCYTLIGTSFCNIFWAIKASKLRIPGEGALREKPALWTVKKDILKINLREVSYKAVA